MTIDEAQDFTRIYSVADHFRRYAADPESPIPRPASHHQPRQAGGCGELAPPGRTLPHLTSPLFAHDQMDWKFLTQDFCLAGFDASDQIIHRRFAHVSDGLGNGRDLGVSPWSE